MQIVATMRVLLMSLMLVAFATHGALADSAVTFFVGKAQLPAVLHGGKVFAPGDAMLHAMGYTWTAEEGGYALQTGTAMGPALSGRLFTLHLGGKTASPQTLLVNGKLWMDARATTEGLGGIYIYTPAAAMAQANFPKTHISQAAVQKAVSKVEAANAKDRARRVSSGGGLNNSGSASTSGSTGDGKTKTTEGAKPSEDEPVSVQRVVFSQGNSGLMHGNIVLKNDADKPIRNVLLYVTMQAPDNAGRAAANNSSANGGQASLPSYVQNTTDGTLPTYGGVPPNAVSRDSYPSAATEVASGGNVYSSGSSSPSGNPTPTPTPAATASPSASASPTPVPMKTIATLAPLYVSEIGAGQTLTVPFQWQNSSNLADVQPTVVSTHDKIEYTRPKPPEEEDADKDKTDADKDKADADKDKMSGDKDKAAGDKTNAKDKTDKTDKSDKSSTDKSKSDGSKPADKSAPPSSGSNGAAPDPKAPPPAPTPSGK